jgi:hypothetical protein
MFHITEQQPGAAHAKPAHLIRTLECARALRIEGSAEDRE